MILVIVGVIKGLLFGDLVGAFENPREASLVVHLFLLVFVIVCFCCDCRFRLWWFGLGTSSLLFAVLNVWSFMVMRHIFRESVAVRGPTVA